MRVRWNRVLVAVVAVVAAVAAALGLPPSPVRRAEAVPAAGTYSAITPVRILDTREPGQGPCLSGTARTLAVADHPLAVAAGVPSDAAAVALNVTVVDATAGGYLTVYPTGVSRPTVSSLNWVSAAAVPNNVQVKLGTGGAVNLYALAGCPQVIVDLVGWYAPGAPVVGGFTGLTPARLLDTAAVGQGPCIAGVRRLTVGGRGGVPTGAAAVALNVTVDAASTPATGYLTVYPAGVPRPTASTVNHRPGGIVPNGTAVRLGVDGAVDLFTLGGCVRVIVDVVGWYAPGAPIAEQGFGGLTPARILDIPAGWVCPNPAAGTVRTFDLQVAGAIGSGVPADAVAAALNVTVDGPGGPGYLTVYPAGAPRPTASNLNYVAGSTVANGVLSRIGTNGAITIHSSAGCPRIVVDVVGTFVTAHQPPQPPRAPIWPNLSDPSVLPVGSTYHVYGSNLLVQGSPVRIPVRSVTDLSRTYPLTGFDSWDSATAEALPTRPAWTNPASTDFWAPTVGRFGSTYVMFFAARRPGIAGGNDQCIGRAVSASPTGPFTPDSSVFSCGVPTSTSPNGGGALDPEVFTAPDGSKYLLAAFSDTSQPIRVIPLDATGQKAGGITVLAGLEFPWEYPFIENPSMVRAPDGAYLLAYSAGDWRTGTYTTATARCSTPLGPCTKAPARSPWLVSGNDRSGTGGLTFFTRTDGTTMAAYASWTTDCEAVPSATAAPRTCRDDAIGVFPWRQGSVSTVDFGVLSPTPLLR
ncbi:MAG: family 43 glycosylhydrolase [Actinomycetes bacterium]